MKRLIAAIAGLCLLATSAIGFYQSRDSNYNVAIATGSGCSQSTTLQARMGGGQNAAAVQAFICGGVTDGWLAHLDALWVLNINSTTNANLNWISTSFSLTNSGCTFTANTGYVSTGACFVDTGFNMLTSGTNYLATGAVGSIGVCQFSGSGGNTYMGVNSAANVSVAQIQLSGPNISYDVNDNAFPGFVYTNQFGFFVANRVNSTGTGVQFYLNGTSVGTSTTSTSVVPPSFTMYLHAANSAGTAVNQSNSGTQIGLAFIGALTPTDITNIRSRYTTYNTAVGGPSGC